MIRIPTFAIFHYHGDDFCGIVVEALFSADNVLMDELKEYSPLVECFGVKLGSALGLSDILGARFEVMRDKPSLSKAA